MKAEFLGGANPRSNGLLATAWRLARASEGVDGERRGPTPNSTSCGLASWNSAPTKAARLGAAGGISLFFAAAAETPSAGETAIKIAVNPAAIRIDNFSYPPPTLVVAPGTTVTWTNADDSPHSVREKDGKFKSAALDTDDTFSQTFTAPGEYEYFCSIHPRMVGKVVVKPAGPSS